MNFNPLITVPITVLITVLIGVLITPFSLLFSPLFNTSLTVIQSTKVVWILASRLSGCGAIVQALPQDHYTTQALVRT
jgi:hypothetical protein